MSLPNLSDPTNLEGLRRDLRLLDPESRLAPLDMLRVTISDDAHLHVKSAVAEALVSSGKAGRAVVVVLTDTTSILRDGARLSLLVEDQLSDQFDVRTEQLDDGHEKLHANDTVLDMAAAVVKGADAIVTIGGGTMTDIGKIAAQRNGGIPQVAVQTAAYVHAW